MNFIVLGTSDFTLCCIKAILESKGRILAIVSLPEYARPLNAINLAEFSKNHRVPYYEIEDINNPKFIRLLKKHNPDYILSSWPKILKKEFLEIARKLVIGTHPTELPYNRGRHPLHWLIALGIKKTKLSFFRMTEGIDSGEVILQVPITISERDSIRELTIKVNSAAYKGTKALYKKITLKHNFIGKKQDEKTANYWRKRTPHDITLDLRMSADAILRTVRSFSWPYPCANLIFRSYLIKISSASLAPLAIKHDQLKRIEPGRILKIRGNIVTLKAADKIVNLKCKDSAPKALKKAAYIYPPSQYFCDYGPVLEKQLANS